MNKKDSCGWDNKINQMILRKCSSKGITCEIIDNGEEALMY
jgi:protein subunit release factor B